jgi:hypothetical protein
LLIIFVSLIIWFLVHRRRDRNDGIQEEADTTLETTTFTDDMEDELECINPISDEGSLGSGSDAFELDSGENISMI